MMLLLPLWAWLLIGTIIIACATLAIYFLVFWRKSQSSGNKLFESLSVVDAATDAQGRLQPGDQLHLSFKGLHAGPVLWSFSRDKGKSWQQVGSNSTNHFDYTLPLNTFSHECMFQVSDAINAKSFVTSNQFSVVPFFTLEGPGSRLTNRRVRINAPTTFRIMTKVWPIMAQSGLQLTYTQAGKTMEVQTVVDQNKRTLTFRVNPAVLDRVFTMRAVTSNLINQGYPQELEYVMPFSLTGVGENNHGEVLAGIFTLFNLLNLDKSLPSEIHPGDMVDFEWTTNNTVSRVDISWSTSREGPFTDVQTGVDGTRGHYRLQVPLTIDTTEDVYFKIVDVSNDANYAVAQPTKVISNWSFFGTPSNLKPIIYPDEWTFSFMLRINGYNLSYSDIGAWKAIMSFPDLKQEKPWTLHDNPDVAIQVDNADVSRNLYRMTFVMTNDPPPLFKHTDGIQFEIQLAHGAGQFEASPFKFHGRLPSSHGISTGPAFTGIQYIPVPGVNPMEAEGVELLSMYPAGATYTFRYTGSHVGTLDNPAPVKWKVRYTKVDASGNTITADLLTEPQLVQSGNTFKETQANTTQGTNNYLSITFPPFMHSTEVTIEVTLPGADVSKDSIPSFTTAPFSVLATLSILPRRGVPGPTLLQDKTNLIHLLTPGDLFWHSALQLKVESSATIDGARTNEPNFTLDPKSREFWWSPSVAGSRFLHIATTNLSTLITGVPELSASGAVPFVVDGSGSTTLRVDGYHQGNTYLLGSEVRVQQNPKVFEDDRKYVFTMLTDAWRVLDGPHNSKSDFVGHLGHTPQSAFYFGLSSEDSMLATVGPYNSNVGCVLQYDPSVKSTASTVRIGFIVYHTPSGHQIGDVQIPWSDVSKWTFELREEGADVAVAGTEQQTSITPLVQKATAAHDFLPTALAGVFELRDFGGTLSGNYELYGSFVSGTLKCSAYTAVFSL